MTTRRTFLKTGTAALGAVAIGPRVLPAAPQQQRPALYTDPATRELMMEALDAAKRAGASWADVRISRKPTSSTPIRPAAACACWWTAAGASRPPRS
jgi:TldD protein